MWFPLHGYKQLGLDTVIISQPACPFTDTSDEKKWTERSCEFECLKSWTFASSLFLSFSLNLSISPESASFSLTGQITIESKKKKKKRQRQRKKETKTAFKSFQYNHTKEKKFSYQLFVEKFLRKDSDWHYLAQVHNHDGHE